MRKTTSILILATIILIIIIGAQQFGLLPIFSVKNQNDSSVFTDLTIASSSVNFTSWELQTWIGMKSRLIVNNTDPTFTGNRTLEWISMRNSSSSDYYQKSMEFLCFWQGQGAKGEWEAVISIYNAPDSTTRFVVEVARFTWHSLQVLLDGNVVVTFPQVTNDTTSLGYATFHVEV